VSTPRTERLSPPRPVAYGLGALAATAAATWALAEYTTPPGAALSTADLANLVQTVALTTLATAAVPALLLAGHRQRTLEAATRTAAEEQRLATERHLRDRYTACAGQLGHDNPAVRLAGGYALAALADDWHTLGNDTERQVCIDLLCAYLRAERRPPTDETTSSSSDGIPGGKSQSPSVIERYRPQSKEQQIRAAIVFGRRREEYERYRQDEQPVRAALLELVRARTRPGGPWDGCRIDLTGIDPDAPGPSTHG